MGQPLTWSGWQALPEAGPWSPQGLRETLLGGQAFRWSEEPPGVFTGTWACHHAQLRLDTAGVLEFRSPVSPDETGEGRAPDPALQVALGDYLAVATDWPALTDALPWRSDAVLHAAIHAFPGLRILRQPFWETLLGFLCSSNKQILQIRQMCEALARNFGNLLHPATGVYALPRPEQLAELELEALLACGLGYRAKYIRKSARILARDPAAWENSDARPPYPEAHARLVRLPGVGPKVADCVLLFGAGYLEAFPMDTWVHQILDEVYHLQEFNPRQKRHFAVTHFGPHAGLAQQFLFSHARHRKNRRLQ